MKRTLEYVTQPDLWFAVIFSYLVVAVIIVCISTATALKHLSSIDSKTQVKRGR